MTFLISYVVFSLIILGNVVYAVVLFTYWLPYPDTVFLLLAIFKQIQKSVVVENLKKIMFL